MPVYKRKYISGTILWFFKFSPPGAARGSLPVRQFGFATKREAEDAEAQRRIEEQQKYDLAKAGSGVAAALPKTLSMLLGEFMRQHAEEKLAPKTVERYREQLACLDAGFQVGADPRPTSGFRCSIRCLGGRPKERPL